MLQAVGLLTDAPVHRLRLRLRVKLMRPPLHAALALIAPAPATLRPGLARRALRAGYRIEGPLPDRVGAIVSTGGDTLYANALLALVTGAPNLFHGSLRGADPRHFTRIVTSRSGNVVAPNAIVLEMTPVPKVARPRREPGPFTVAVLVGGDGGGYRFTQADWRALAERLVEIDRTGARLLLTTSRRTAAAGEAMLAEAVARCRNLDRAVFYNRAPERVMADFLARGDLFVVTPESTSMITESVLTGRPVLLAGAAPEGADPRHRRFLDQLLQDRRVEMLAPGAPLPDAHALRERHRPVGTHPVDQLAEALRPLWARG